jgi:restriction system protein
MCAEVHTVAIPTYDQFIEPLLRYLAEQHEPVSTATVYAAVADATALTPEDRAALLRSGGQRVYQNRIGWAHDRLKRRSVSASPKRGFWQLTDHGRAFAKSHPHLSATQLEEIANSWKEGPSPRPIEPPIADLGPEERIDQAVAEIRDSVARDLLERIHQASAEFFERVVLELLHAMGYGESREDLQHVGGPGDEGIDGVIALDRLGLDRVFVQAKRWKGPVGGPQVQTFLGALKLKGTEKGVLMTPGDVTKDARQLAAKTNGNLVLIDGTRLAKLMIEHRVGVSERPVAVPRVDQDFFPEE